MDETTVKSHSDAQLEGHEVTHKPDLKQTNSPLTCGSGAENAWWQYFNSLVSQPVCWAEAIAVGQSDKNGQ